MRAGPTYASHFSVVSQTLGRPSESSAVRFARSKHGPNNACILVGDCHRGTVEAAPLPKLVDPLVVEIGLAGRRSHDRAGAMDEQTAQVLVPALRDAHQHLAIAAGELSRDETNPGGEVPTILEL